MNCALTTRVWPAMHLGEETGGGTTLPCVTLWKRPPQDVWKEAFHAMYEPLGTWAWRGKEIWGPTLLSKDGPT